jgi:acyl carrier protein
MSPAEIREEILDLAHQRRQAFPQLALDSMDFLDIVMELRKRHRVNFPKRTTANWPAWTAP